MSSRPARPPWGADPRTAPVGARGEATGAGWSLVRVVASEVLVVAACLSVSLVLLGHALETGASDLYLFSSILGGLVGAALVPLRRWAPFAVAVVTAVLSAVADAAGVAAVVALFALATRRSWRPVVLVGALHVLAVVTHSVLFEDPEVPVLSALWWSTLALLVVIVAAVAGTGLYVGARRELLASTRERAERAEAEQVLLAERARERERTRIAREMHDVLAHRLSLLALHAGALEYRADAAGGEVAEAAAVVRENAHQALQDLRGVLGVLRSRDGEAGLAPLDPQPGAGQVPELVAEATAAGGAVDLEVVGVLAEVPDAVGRAVYRVVQEGLTNARRHAPGAAVAVRVAVHDDAVHVDVLNGPAATAPDAPLDGRGAGLVGVAERAALLGGHVRSGGTADGGFALRALLPVPHDDEPLPAGAEQPTAAGAGA